jgi:hypothetical protein
MPIITIDQIFQIIRQSNEVFQQLFSIILNESIKSILSNLGSVFSSLVHGDWSMFLVSATTLIGITTFTYRLVRKKPFMAIKSMFNK